MGSVRSGRSKANFNRKGPTLRPKPTILIVCEGEHTEPDYFNGFRLSSATVEAIGTGYNTVSLVKRAVKLAEGRAYDQVWCVFDKDDFDAASFDTAIQLAASKNFKVAWSNQAFEYWLILHFDDHQGGGMTRRGYHDKLNTLLEKLGLAYDGKGSKHVSKELFLAMEGIDPQIGKSRRCLAIDRARRNLQAHQGKPASQAESATTVFRLVEELNRHLNPAVACK
jgi:hypothetical protein